MALGASISSFLVINFNFIFISLLCSFLELNQCNQGYRLRAGILAWFSLPNVLLFSPWGYLEAAGSRAQSRSPVLGRHAVAGACPCSPTARPEMVWLHCHFEILKSKSNEGCLPRDMKGRHKTGSQFLAKGEDANSNNYNSNNYSY